MTAETATPAEAKEAAPTTAPAASEGWEKTFNEREKEEIEQSIKSVNEFSQDLERIRAAMKKQQQ